MRLPGCFQVYCARGEWVQMGHIDAKCRQCGAYLDPHLFTFDGFHYDFHGTCEYALAQDGSTTSPQYAVNSEFIHCWRAACVGPSTFKDSPGTIIKMGAYGRYPPDLYKILVNGVLYEIRDQKPRFVKDNATKHPVLAWRYGRGCIRLIGSSEIAVEKCVTSLSVWASPQFHGKLYGLCGYFDGTVGNDFTIRNGTPSGVQFPDFWRTTCGEGDILGASPELTEISGQVTSCTVEKEVEDRLRSQCSQTIAESGSLPQEMISILNANCLFDLCSIYRNTSGNASTVQEWLGEVKTSVEDISDVYNKTSGNKIVNSYFTAVMTLNKRSRMQVTDVLPEILFLDPFNVTTVVTDD